MSRILITGAGGFVGRYLCEHLLKKEDSVILGIDLAEELFFQKEHDAERLLYRQTNLTDSSAIRSILSGFQPEYIFHLAAFSSVGQSWKQPVDTFVNNTNIFLNIVDAVRELALPCRVLSIGSSEEYGGPCPPAYTEDSPLAGNSPYAAARISQEILSKLYADHLGVDVVMTRSFNHFGPRQRTQFVIPSYVERLLEVKRNGGKGQMITGNTDIVRDFLDVRDVVEAYALILEKGKKGEIYNVCSGVGISLKDIIVKLSEIIGVDVECVRDESLIRPFDNPVVIGDNSKLKALGWVQRYSLDKTLKEMTEERR